MKNYKACIDDFIREHQEARDLHNNVVNKAVKEWNSFVSEDMPSKRDDSISVKTGVSQGGSHTVGNQDPTSIYKNLKF